MNGPTASINERREKLNIVSLQQRVKLYKKIAANTDFMNFDGRHHNYIFSNSVRQ